MNTKAWAWTSGGDEKLDRPIASCTEKPATITTAMVMAPPRKKPSSRPPATGSLSATVVIRFPPRKIPRRLCTQQNGPASGSLGPHQTDCILPAVAIELDRAQPGTCEHDHRLWRRTRLPGCLAARRDGAP